MIEKKLIARSSYRSVRYYSLRKDSKTVDRPFLPKFKDTSVNKIDSVFYRTYAVSTQCKEQQQISTRPSYLQTFTNLMTCPNDRPIDSPKDPSITPSPRRQPPKCQRVLARLDSRFSQQDSQFTLLDQIYKPYTYLQKLAEDSRTSLAEDREDLDHLRYQFRKLQNLICGFSDDCMEEGMTAIQRISLLLRKNQTHQQERKMRVKREIGKLTQEMTTNRQLFESLQNKTTQLQSNVFNCQALELSFEGEEVPYPQDQLIYF